MSQPMKRRQAQVRNRGRPEGFTSDSPEGGTAIGQCPLFDSEPMGWAEDFTFSNEHPQAS